MSTFTYIPDRPATESSSPRVRLTRFGTYEQRTTFGVNPFRDSWSLRFGHRSISDASAIDAFLRARDGQESFEWETPFGETAQFRCSEWSVRLESCDYRSVDAQFELQYEAGATNPALPAGDATTFTWIPDFTADLRYRSNPRVMQFGDGYAQRLKIGLNAQDEPWALQFRNRSNTERDAIRTFLRQARGRTAFSWTDPLGVSGQYVCSDWAITFNNHNNNDIKLTLRRVFE